MPQWASALRQWRRDQLGDVSQEEIALRTDGVLNQLQISRVERGLLHPTESMSANQLEALLNGYGLTPQQFSLVTGLTMPFSLSEENKESRTALPNMKMARFVSALAGKPVEAMYEIPSRYWRPGCVLADIQGDSMEPTLSEGDWAFFDTTLRRLRDARIYLFHIPGDGHVVKRVYKVNGHWEAVSDNRAYRPRPLDEEWEVIGEFYDALGPKR